MDAARHHLLEVLWQEGRTFDAQQADRLDRRRNLEPDSAQFLNLVLTSRAPSAVLELGTSNGYSTIWIADALEPVDGLVVTVENDPGRAAQAGRNLAEARVADRVEQRLADAAQILAGETSASWPVIFLDAERAHYVSYWGDLARVLEPGGLLVVDNCISHADQVAEFRQLVDQTPGFRSSLVPLGAGLLFVVKDH